MGDYLFLGLAIMLVVVYFYNKYRNKKR